MLMEPIGRREAADSIVPPTSNSASPSPYHAGYNRFILSQENKLVRFSPNKPRPKGQHPMGRSEANWLIVTRIQVRTRAAHH